MPTDTPTPRQPAGTRPRPARDSRQRPHKSGLTMHDDELYLMEALKQRLGLTMDARLWRQLLLDRARVEGLLDDPTLSKEAQAA